MSADPEIKSVPGGVVIRLNQASSYRDRVFSHEEAVALAQRLLNQVPFTEFVPSDDTRAALARLVECVEAQGADVQRVVIGYYADADPRDVEIETLAGVVPACITRRGR